MWSSIKKKPAPADGEVQEAPISRIVSAIIHQAIRDHADSIQLVPIAAGMRVEYLKEGIWRETLIIPKHHELAITTHLKEMAGLPTEYRMAMQGLILVRSASGLTAAHVIDAEGAVPIPAIAPQPGEQDFDIHLIVTPTRQGEKITLNIEAADRSPE